MYRLAYRLAGNQHDAEDLTQETYIRVFRSLSSYTPGTFEGWLHRITTNLFLDMARRRSRLRMEGLPEDTDRLAGDGPSPQQVYSQTHLDPDLQDALDELAPEFRAAVVLCDVEGLSYEEIGATLGVKLGTVRSRIHRGRQALRAVAGAAAFVRRPRGVVRTSGIFFHAGASGAAVPGRRPREPLQFVLAAGDGMAVQSRDPCQQGDASATVLACQKADEEPSGAFVGSGDEAVDPAVFPPRALRGCCWQVEHLQEWRTCWGFSFAIRPYLLEMISKRGKVIIVGTWAK